MEGGLAQRIEFRGQSGATYAFRRLEDEAILRPIGVTYAIAAPTADGWRLLEAGHVSNLAERRWAPALAAARAAHPDAELLVRLNINRAIREAEANDLARAIS